MEKIPFISIVIPTTGNVRFIKGLVESIDKLDYPKDKYELILIENFLLEVEKCPMGIEDKYNIGFLKINGIASKPITLDILK